MNSMFPGMDFSTMVEPRPFAMAGFLLCQSRLKRLSVLNKDVFRLVAQPADTLIVQIGEINES